MAQATAKRRCSPLVMWAIRLVEAAVRPTRSNKLAASRVAHVVEPSLLHGCLMATTFQL